MDQGGNKKLPEMTARQRKQMAQQLSSFFESDKGQALIKEGMIKLRELKVPYFKGRWTRTLNKMAGKVGKGLGVSVQVAYECHKTVKAQGEYEQHMRDKQGKIKRTARKTARDVKYSVQGVVPDLAIDIFQPFIELMGDLSAQSMEEEKTPSDLRRQLSEHHRRLGQIRLGR